MIDGYVRYTYHYSDMYYTRVWAFYGLGALRLAHIIARSHNFTTCKITQSMLWAIR